MKNLFFLTCVFCVLVETSAQNQFLFNSIFDDPALSVSSVSAETNGEHYYIATLMGDQSWGGVYLRILEIEGGEVELISVDEGTELRSIVFGGNMEATNDAIMLASAESEQPFGGETDILLAKIDHDGNIVWKKSYGDTLSQKPAQILPTADNGYLIVGAQQYQLNPAYFYALKIDSAGTPEWENTYGLDGHSAAFSAVQTQDGGFLISGYGYHLTKGYELFFVRTDAFGTELWSKNYGTMDDDGAAHLTPTGGGYIMRGSIKENNRYKQYIALTDYDVEILSAQTIARGEVFSLQTPLVPDGDGYVASGFCADIDGDPAMGVLAKFNLAGDTLWTRTYKTSPLSDDYFRDVDVAPDGGYLLTGFVYESPQKSWVVKTDAEGNTCSFVGCDSILVPPLAAPLPERNPYRVSVSPNPAPGWAEVGYRLPMRSPCGHIRLYALSGREVLAARLHTYTQSRRLDLSGLPAGVYPYEVTFEGRRVYAGKLVVE